MTDLSLVERVEDELQFYSLLNVQGFKEKVTDCNTVLSALEALIHNQDYSESYNRLFQLETRVYSMFNQFSSRFSNPKVIRSLGLKLYPQEWVDGLFRYKYTVDQFYGSILDLIPCVQNQTETTSTKLSSTKLLGEQVKDSNYFSVFEKD
jgi:hypothetical protein